MAETKTAIEPLILAGDCLEYLRDIDDDSIDAIITDPPYGLSNTDPAHVVEAITQWASGNREFVPHKKGGFMGKEWDSFVPPPAVWDECLRILKPGGHLLTFAGTRTMDLMTLGLRLAGFDIRDSLAWLYGSGFPKSMDVSKAIDKASGAEREVVGTRKSAYGSTPSGEVWADGRTGGGPGLWVGSDPKEVPLTGGPATPEAAKWQGWGTALKPAFEPIIMARKPFKGTVAANVLEHGTGALNIDATRIAANGEKLGGGAEKITTADQKGDEGWTRPWMSDPEAQEAHAGRVRDNVAKAESLGRWPANVILGHTEGCEPVGTRKVKSGTAVQRNGGGQAIFGGIAGQPGSGDQREDATYAGADGMETVEAWNCAPGCPVADLDAQSGTLKSGKAAKGGHRRTAANMDEASEGGRIYGGSKGIAGTSSTNDAGVLYGDTGGASRFFYCAKAPKKERPGVVGEDGKKTAHPTVKPLALMRWLIRLVTPPGGIVLDPFAGSGTTVEARMLEGFEVWAIESEADYLPLIQVRIDRVMAEAHE